MNNNKLKTFLLVIVLVLSLGALALKNTITNNDFKTEYESINNKKNSHGKNNRVIKISDNNKFIKTTSKEIVAKLKSRETFYLYIGDKSCPWCRSVIEKAVEISNKKNIKKIYYLNIWDDDGNEILRDKYEVVDNKLVKTVDGSKEYYQMLKYFDSVLKEYTIEEENTSYDTKEKRIYAPNFFYVEDGQVVRFTTGISENQKDPYCKLTAQILSDEEEQFNSLFR